MRQSTEFFIRKMTGIASENIICKICQQNVIKSEYHFLLCNNRLKNLRIKYFGKITWPSVYKFIYIMSPDNNKKLFKFAKML